MKKKTFDDEILDLFEEEKDMWGDRIPVFVAVVMATLAVFGLWKILELIIG